MPEIRMGLNKRLNEKIKNAIQAADKNQTSFAILFFDFDRFKLINDSLSHLEGDELLQSVAYRLLSKVRLHDTLARFGGDEFVMIVSDFDKIEKVITIAGIVLSTVKEPVKLKGHTISITTSIGISIYPKDGKTVNDLLRNADAAMYHAKNSGYDQFQFYSLELHEKNLKELEIETQLNHAIKNNELTLWYQPQFDTKENTLNAVEALIRWNHPTRGLLLPDEFISVAETTGLIVPMGEWVIREACKQNKAWQISSLPPIRVAINITSHQLRQPGFVTMVETILKETQLEPKFVEFELSENCIINNEASIKTINAIKKLGIEIAVDDFGTGYSSLSYLKNLSLSRLKIDKSFIQNIHHNRGDKVLVHAIIEMAHALNLKVIAEGVENKSQLNFLKNEDCTDIQGYYFSHPLSSADLTKLLNNPVKIKKILGSVKNK